MKNNFSSEVKKILKTAEREMYDLNHPYVGSEHMLLGILKISENLKTLLNSYNLTYEKFKSELINVVGSSRKKSEIALYTPLLKRVIAGAEEEADATNNGIVEPSHLLISMFEEGEGIGMRILYNMDINVDAIYSDLLHKTNKNQKDKNSILLEIGRLLTPKENEVIYKRDKEINNLI